MELVYLTAAVAAAFWGGWLTARTIYGDPRPRHAVKDDPIAPTVVEDCKFTRSVMDWGRRYER